MQEDKCYSLQLEPQQTKSLHILQLLFSVTVYSWTATIKQIYAFCASCLIWFQFQEFCDSVCWCQRGFWGECNAYAQLHQFLFSECSEFGFFCSNNNHVWIHYWLHKSFLFGTHPKMCARIFAFSDTDILINIHSNVYVKFTILIQEVTELHSTCSRRLWLRSASI